MKVVLFCGGFGMRLREFSENIPKPLVNIGYRPILWHVMKYYAHFGHKDFILCLGWKGDSIKNYFLNYDECVSNDFVMSGDGNKVKLLNSDIHDWTITFVDTGAAANIGQRLKAVEKHLEGEETFLANYSDGLSDVPLSDMIKFHHSHQAIATFLAVKPTQSFHAVSMGSNGRVKDIRAIGESDVWMNGGYMVLNREIFDVMEDGEELVCEPFERLIHAEKLAGYKYRGFWGCMDTFKEKQRLDDMVSRGESPWEVWKRTPDELHPVPATGNGTHSSGHRPK